MIQDAPGDGLFTEGCLALVEGEYTDDSMLEIVAIGQPPCESRSTARYDIPLLFCPGVIIYVQINLWSHRLPRERRNISSGGCELEFHDFMPY